MMAKSQELSLEFPFKLKLQQETPLDQEKLFQMFPYYSGFWHNETAKSIDWWRDHLQMMRRGLSVDSTRIIRLQVC